MEGISVIVASNRSNLRNVIKVRKENLINELSTPIEWIFVDDSGTGITPSGFSCFRTPSANSGVSCARNIGIANASNKYLYFLDDDDKVNLSFPMFEKAIDKSPDLILGSVHDEKGTYHYEELRKDGKWWWGSLHAKLFLNENIIPFREIVKYGGEDQLFCLENLMKLESLSLKYKNNEFKFVYHESEGHVHTKYQFEILSIVGEMVHTVEWNRYRFNVMNDYFRNLFTLDRAMESGPEMVKRYLEVYTEFVESLDNEWIG